MLERAAQLEEAKIQDIFDINDTSTLELVQFNKLYGCDTIRELPEEYPLYFILKLFNSLVLNPEQQKTLSSETIYRVSDLTVQKLKNSSKSKLDKTEVHYCMADFILIKDYLGVLIVKNSPFKEALLDLVVRTGFAIEKN